jgi:hypothetical protein
LYDDILITRIARNGFIDGLVACAKSASKAEAA